MSELFTVPSNEETEVKLRIRRIPFELGLRMESRYGREELIVNAQGFKRPQRVHSGDEEVAILKDKAA